MNFSDYFRILLQIVSAGIRFVNRFGKIKNKVKAFFSLPDDISKMKANMSKMEKDIMRILKIGGIIFTIGIFIVAMISVLIVANSFYMRATNTRLDKIEDTQDRFKKDITLKLDQLLDDRRPKSLRNISSKK